MMAKFLREKLTSCSCLYRPNRTETTSILPGRRGRRGRRSGLGTANLAESKTSHAHS